MQLVVSGDDVFLGSNLLEKLLNEGRFVVGIDNLSVGKFEKIESCIDDIIFAFVKKDIFDQSTYYVLEHNFDLDIHLAACEITLQGNAKAISRTDTGNSKNVLQYIRSTSCKNVKDSISEIYGVNPDLFVKEDGNCLTGNLMMPHWTHANSNLVFENAVEITGQIVWHSTYRYTANCTSDWLIKALR